MSESKWRGPGWTTPGEPKGRGATWTEERRRSDEGRGRLESGPEASGTVERRLEGGPEASGTVERRLESGPEASGKTERRNELAAFLRSRRERITPEDVGLPGGHRRRTLALVHRRSRISNSCSRPTSGVRAPPCIASKRLSTERGLRTMKACGLPTIPFSSCPPMSSSSNRSPINRRVASAMTTLSDAAIPCNRAARLGVSPTTPRSCASPEPRRSPTTTIPVAMPTRTCSGAPAGVSNFGAASTMARPARTACSASCSRARVSKIGEHAVAHVFRDETTVAGDQRRATPLVSCDDATHVLGIETRRRRRRAHKIAEHDGKLAALGGGRGCRVRGALPLGRSVGPTKVCDGLEEALSVAHGHAEFLEVALGKIGQHRAVDFVRVEKVYVLAQTQAPEPIAYVHAPPSALAHPPSATRAAYSNFANCVRFDPAQGKLPRSWTLTRSAIPARARTKRVWRLQK